MKHIAAYCRVSTNNQKDSLKAQIDHYKQYGDVSIYYDEGLSGTKKDTRPGLKQMLLRKNLQWLWKQNEAS